MRLKNRAARKAEPVEETLKTMQGIYQREVLYNAQRRQQQVVAKSRAAHNKVCQLVS